MSERDPRKFAEECLKQAEGTSSETERAVFLDMAQGWLRIAERREMIAALEVAPPGDNHATRDG
jgi:hypothetical protein